MKNKQVGYFDMDGVFCDYHKKVNMLTERNPYMTPDSAHRVKGFFLDLEPMPGAIEAYMELKEYFQIIFLSTPSWSNPDSYMEKRIWLESHLGEHCHKNLILSHHKYLNVGRFLVDDHIEGPNGKFTGEIIHFGHNPFENWEVTVPYLKTLA